MPIAIRQAQVGELVTLQVVNAGGRLKPKFFVGTVEVDVPSNAMIRWRCVSRQGCGRRFALIDNNLSDMYYIRGAIFMLYNDTIFEIEALQ